VDQAGITVAGLTFNSNAVNTTITSSNGSNLISAALSGLPGSIYHYRLDATNAFGLVYGGDQVFTVGFAPTANDSITEYDGPSYHAAKTGPVRGGTWRRSPRFLSPGWDQALGM